MEKKKVRGRGKAGLLQEQLERALADAEELQHQPQKNRGEESYISQCKLVSARLSAIQKLLSRKDNSTLQALRAQNEKLKQKVVALKLEVETLKTQRPAEPVAPAKDPVLERMLADAAARRQRIATASPEVRPTPLPSKGDSFDPELSRRNFPPVSLIPAREEGVVQLPDKLAQPRPVITPAEEEKKAIAASCNLFNDDRTQANVKRIQAEARKTAEASKSQVSIIT